MSAAPPTLTVSTLACERGGKRLFENLYFHAGPSECIELRGPNGSGKSSLLRLLAGLDEPAAGSIGRVGSLSYVGHLDAIKPALTVRENLAFWASLMDTSVSDTALAAFNLTALADEQAAILSQGQRRRLALSRLAITHTDLWLLDEPTVGLDEASLAQLRNLIVAHCQAQGIVIAATHVSLGVPVNQTLTLGAST